MGVQAVADGTELRDDSASWNVARPLIKESIGGLAVTSVATWLLAAIAMTTAIVCRGRITSGGPPLVRLAGVALAAAGGLLWLGGARRTGGPLRVFADVNAVQALDVFENYTRYIDGWSAQTAGLATAAVGGALLTAMALLSASKTGTVLDSGSSRPTQTEEPDVNEVDS